MVIQGIDPGIELMVAIRPDRLAHRRREFGQKTLPQRLGSIAELNKADAARRSGHHQGAQSALAHGVMDCLSGTTGPIGRGCHAEPPIDLLVNPAG